MNRKSYKNEDFVRIMQGFGVVLDDCLTKSFLPPTKDEKRALERIKSDNPSLDEQDKECLKICIFRQERNKDQSARETLIHIYNKLLTEEERMKIGNMEDEEHALKETILDALSDERIVVEGLLILKSEKSECAYRERKRRRIGLF